MRARAPIPSSSASSATAGLTTTGSGGAYPWICCARRATSRGWGRPRPTAAGAGGVREVDGGEGEIAAVLVAGNVDKTMTAPATAIIGLDVAFFKALPKLFPQTDAKAWFVGNDLPTDTTAMRNSVAPGGVFHAGRPVAGARLRADVRLRQRDGRCGVLRGTTVRSNFLCNLGHGEPAMLRPRGPRLAFDDACTVL